MRCSFGVAVFVKSIMAGIEKPDSIKIMMSSADMELPYEGAKEMQLVDNVENKEFLCELLEEMYDEIPAPKKRSKQIVPSI